MTGAGGTLHRRRRAQQGAAGLALVSARVDGPNRDGRLAVTLLGEAPALPVQFALALSETALPFHMAAILTAPGALALALIVLIPAAIILAVLLLLVRLAQYLRCNLAKNIPQILCLGRHDGQTQHDRGRSKQDLHQFPPTG